ncbi:MAG: HEAT repeat domain-containing protein, partial [Promethearchaeota archaeon]
DQVEKSILNQAIITEDLQVFGKYLTHKDTRIRKLLVDHLLDYIRLQPRMTPGVKTQISKIFAQFLFDPDETIQQKLLHSLNLILENIEVDTQYAVAQRLLEKETSSSIKISFQVLNHILDNHTTGPEGYNKSFSHLPNYVIRSGTPEIQSNLMNFMNKLKRKNLPETRNFIFTLLKMQNRFNLLFAYNFIAQFPNIMKDQTLNLIPIMEKHLKLMDIELVTQCFHTLVRIAVNDTTLIPKVMSEFNNLTLKEYDIIREKIGALVQFNLAKPEWFSQFFAYLKIYFEHPNLKIVADATVALGTMTTPILLHSFFSEIYPYFSKLIRSGDLNVKKAVISSLIVIAQTRKDIYKEERFQRLFTLLIVDPHPDIRHQVYRFFIQGDPKFILMDIAILLKTPLELPIRIDLLNVLSQISGEIIAYVDELDLYNILTNQPIGDEQNLSQKQKHKLKQNQVFLTLEKIHALQQDKSTIFGFNSFNQTFSLYDAVVALLYEITYFIPDKYEDLLKFTRQNQLFEGDLSLAKKLEFYSKLILDELNLTRIFGIDYSLTDLITQIQNDFASIQSHGVEVLLEYLPQIYKKKTDYHKEIFEIYASIYVRISKKNPLSIKIKSRGELLLGMVQIIVDHQDIYFAKTSLSLLPKRKVITKNPLEYIVSPFILNCMCMNEALLQKNLFHSMNLMVNDLTEKQFVRDFLIQALLKTSNPNMKISAMKSFAALPIIIEEKRNINVFLSQLKFKHTGVKAQAIESLGIIIRAFPTIPIKGKGKDANLVRKLLYQGFYDQYSISADILVRTTIIHQLQTIILIQPNFAVSLKILEQLSREPDEKLAYDSIQLFFNYIDFTQKSLGEKLIVLHRYSNSPHHSVLKEIAEKISETWGQNIQISSLFPILINLTTSQFQDIRSMAFKAIFEIFEGHPEVMNSFYQNLYKLTKDDNAEVRSDALEILYRIATTLPIEVKDIQKINQISQKLANDPSFEMREQIAKNLSLMIKNFPQYYPAYVHICINFLRSNHPELIKLTIMACRNLIASNSDLNKVIYRKGAKIFKKTQNPLLETLLTDIKGSLS